MRITKKSLGKIPDRARFSATTTSFLPRPPPTPPERLLPLIEGPRDRPGLSKIPPIARKPSVKITEVDLPQREGRKQTETTEGGSSMMFQSMYGKEWLKPSEIGTLKLLGEGNEVQALEINLGDRMDRNLQRFARLRDVTEKWVQVLRKALSYVSSARVSSDKLIEEVKFWKALSRKFDELEYEFNDSRATGVISIMNKLLKTEPQFRQLMEQFLSLKEQVISLTPAIKKLHLQLEQVVSGFILKLETCCDIRESAELLRKVLLGFEAIAEENELIRSRERVILEKIEDCMAQKLVATSLYPRQLANISSVKENYQVIDRALSFYSHLQSSLQEKQQGELAERAEHVRLVLANLLQILSYFQHLYHAKEVNQFSKLFSHPLDFNIYDPQNAPLWSSYMQLVEASMQAHHFEA